MAAGWGGSIFLRGLGAVWVFGGGRPCFRQFFDVKVPQIQFIDGVLACSCTTETGIHSVLFVMERVDAKNAFDGFCLRRGRVLRQHLAHRV